MPSPAAVRRSSNRKDTTTPTKKTLDIGKPLGPYDNNSIRERVRQWQDQGGGVITASDICVDIEDDDEEPAAEATTPEPPARKAGNANGKESTKAQPSPKRGEAKTEDKKEERPKSSGTPRKRIVSDGHWRRKRTPPKNAESAKSKLKNVAASKVFDDGIRVTPIPDEEQEQTVKPRQTRSAGPTPKKKTYQDDGIRVYATPPQSRHTSTQAQSSSGQEDSGSRRHLSDCEDDHGESRSASPSPQPTSSDHKGANIDAARDRIQSSQNLGSSGRGRDDKLDSTRSKNFSAESSPREEYEPRTERRESKKSSRGIFGHVLEESKKMFARTETIYVSPSENPRIDAWLGGVPDLSEDPFAADEEPIEIPAPLKINPRKKRRPKDDVVLVEDANKIWDSVSTVPDSASDLRRRRKSSRKSREPDPEVQAPEVQLDDIVEESEEVRSKSNDDREPRVSTSPSPLRRRGARRKSTHSPRGSPLEPSRKDSRQGSPLKESFSINQDEDISHVSSGKTVSSVEPLDPNASMNPPSLKLRRPFPSVGAHRLSTIASVDTLNSNTLAHSDPTILDLPDQTRQQYDQMDDEVQSEARDHFDPTSLDRNPSKSRLARHADLISVLSTPGDGTKSLQSARSIRTSRSRLKTATIDDLMQELVNDELKYMRELRTLVDGVIPVLLASVLSKTESAITAGLFSPSGNFSKDSTVSNYIYQMGVCLEALKKWHKRLEPQRSGPISPTSFLNWAQGVQKTYHDYVKAWRMGFQDVVVNLAPATTEEQSTNSADPVLETGLPRNDKGDVVGNDGERVDVAFLLKRPLVRLKYLAKTLKGMSLVQSSTLAERLAGAYHDLVTEARNRANAERARLEDEAAANIDPARARDPQTLGPLSGVVVDKYRRVRARDLFYLSLLHTNGQRIDCRVELLLRDDSAENGTESDLLICEIDGSGRYLLFSPILGSCVSARNGDTKAEIVVMIRGHQSGNSEWHELLSLTADDEQTGFEWVQMIGLTPVPPQLTRMSSFHTGKEKVSMIALKAPSTPTKSRMPSLREIEIPIGEKASGSVKTWTVPVRAASEQSPEKPIVQSGRSKLQKRLPLIPPLGDVTEQAPEVESDERQNLRTRRDSHAGSARAPKSLNEAMDLAGDRETALRRRKATRHSRELSSSPSAPAVTPKDEVQTPSTPKLDSTPPQSPRVEGKDLLSSKSPSSDPTTKPLRPRYHHRTSSVPSMDLPMVPKVRKNSGPSTPIDEPEKEPEWVATSAPRTPNKLTKERKKQEDSQEAPPPPPHRTQGSIKLDKSPAPDFSPIARTVKRRSSSPLKHEYEPSTASSSPDDSDASTVGHNENTSETESSSEDDEELEESDIAMPLLPAGALQRRRKSPASVPSLPSKTLGPSSSASQAPYKTVPSQPEKALKAIATLSSWSDTERWKLLHPDECSIVVTPGCIEAFEMSSAHSHTNGGLIASSKSVSSAQSSSDVSPSLLLRLELTPLVPIRQGTAIDIEIRSPPQAGSNKDVATTNLFLFRSRSIEECAYLYSLINYARIHNPTFIALQNARATSFAQPQFSNVGLARGQTVRGSKSSWFGLGRRGSYRASSAPTPSISKTESSVGSRISFSALNLFKGNSRFSIARSTILSRQNSRAGSIYTTSDNSNSSGSGTSTPIPGNGGLAPGANAPIGLSNRKIRLYIRQSMNKWRDLGSARLTIMHPTNASHPPLPGTDGTLNAAAPEPTGIAFGVGAGNGVSSPGRKRSAKDKRIVVIGKAHNRTLLDVTLGESCFERIGRVGIAMSVWEDFEGGMVAAEGGVVGGRLKVFMIQMKSEAEAAFTFGHVGRHRSQS